MTHFVFDSEDDLLAEGGASRIVLTEGTAFIDFGVASAAAIAVQATGKQRITIAATRTVQGQQKAIDLQSADSAVFNDGTIKSVTAAALYFATTLRRVQARRR